LQENPSCKRKAIAMTQCTANSGDQLLVPYLRPARIDAAKHSRAILKLLVRRLREVWPDVPGLVESGLQFHQNRHLLPLGVGPFEGGETAASRQQEGGGMGADDLQAARAAGRRRRRGTAPHRPGRRRVSRDRLVSGRGA